MVAPGPPLRGPREGAGGSWIDPGSGRKSLIFGRLRPDPGSIRLPVAPSKAVIGSYWDRWVVVSTVSLAIPWCAPRGHWPVAPWLVEDVAGLHGIEGLATAAAHLRKQCLTQLVPPQKGLIDTKKELKVHLSCWQAHPGVCVTKDADIYASVIQLARNIERFFGVSDEGSFVRSPHPLKTG